MVKSENKVNSNFDSCSIVCSLPLLVWVSFWNCSSTGVSTSVVSVSRARIPSTISLLLQANTPTWSPGVYTSSEDSSNSMVARLWRQNIVLLALFTHYQQMHTHYQQMDTLTIRRYPHSLSAGIHTHYQQMHTHYQQMHKHSFSAGAHTLTWHHCHAGLSSSSACRESPSCCGISTEL